MIDSNLQLLRRFIAAFESGDFHTLRRSSMRMSSTTPPRPAVRLDSRADGALIRERGRTLHLRAAG
jgi:hypothetical protein